MRLRNLTSGETVEVTRRSPQVPLARLDLLYARVGPDGPQGDGRILLGGTVKLHRTLRPQLQQFLKSGPDGEQVLDWFRHELQPQVPAMVNFEGEPILLTSARYHVEDPAAVAEQLRKRLVEGSEGEFVETVQINGRPVHRGHVRLDGDVVEIQTNSAKRLRHLERLDRSAAPDARLLGREQRTPEEAMASRDPSDAVAPAHLPPEAAAGALEAFMAEQEERWVDEPIPALGGRSPRTAAADPAWRPALEALLNDFEWIDAQAESDRMGRGMNPARLRNLLGLPSSPR